MNDPLNVLILEDRPEDAELAVYELERAGFHLKWDNVTTKEAYSARLERAASQEAPLDLILADFYLPQFDGLTALELLNGSGLDIPFILVSGTIGEEMAVTALKQGAADYLLKDRLARLGQAVSHALEEKKLRDQNRLANQRLRESEERYRRLVEFSPDGIAVYSTGKIVFINQTGVNLLGIRESRPDRGERHHGFRSSRFQAVGEDASA